MGFERGELRSASEAERELQEARQAARNTFNKTRRVNLRMTERDFNLAHSRAREEGIFLSDAAVQRHPQVPVRPTNREELARRWTTPGGFGSCPLVYPISPCFPAASHCRASR